jgi:hypothetical protein
MREFINRNFTPLLILALLLVLFSQGFFDRPPAVAPTVVVVSDTTYRPHQGTVVTQAPPVVQYVPYPVASVRDVVQDTAAVRRVVEDYLATRVQEDSIKIDSLGSVTARTYTTRNRVDSIRWAYNLRERTINNTITIREPYVPRRTLLVGGGVSATPQLALTGAEAGALYLDRRQRLYGAGVEYRPQTGLQVELRHYRPIRFNKK